MVKKHKGKIFSLKKNNINWRLEVNGTGQKTQA